MAFRFWQSPSGQRRHSLTDFADPSVEDVMRHLHRFVGPNDLADGFRLRQPLSRETPFFRKKVRCSKERVHLHLQPSGFFVVLGVGGCAHFASPLWHFHRSKNFSRVSDSFHFPLILWNAQARSACRRLGRTCQFLLSISETEARIVSFR